MTRTLKPAGAFERTSLMECERLLRTARDFAKQAGAPKTADAIRDALKSCGGALRHMDRRAADAPLPAPATDPDHPFAKGAVVVVFNQTMSGEPIIESKRAIVVKALDGGHLYRVRFPGAGLGDPGRTGVDRFVWPGEPQTAPEAYLAKALADWRARQAPVVVANRWWTDETPKPAERTITGETLVDVLGPDGAEPRRGLRLDSVLGDDVAEWAAAFAFLATDGEVHLGGGAAPAFTIILHDASEQRIEKALAAMLRRSAP